MTACRIIHLRSDELPESSAPIRIRFFESGSRDQGTCPKCGLARGNGDACTRCGLATAHMERFAQAADDEVPEELEDSWRWTLAGWQDTERHDELLASITQHGAWVWGARCYREVMRQRPKDKVAARYAERIRRGIEATMFATMAKHSSTEAAKPYRATRRLLLGMIVLAVLGLALLAVLRDRSAEASPTPPDVMVR